MQTGKEKKPQESGPRHRRFPAYAVGLHPTLPPSPAAAEGNSSLYQYQADHLCTSHLPLLIHLLICLNNTSAGPLCLPHGYHECAGEDGFSNIDSPRISAAAM